MPNDIESWVALFAFIAFILIIAASIISVISSEKDD